MALIGLLLVSLLTMFSSVYAYGGGWINAHATFYGGGDASGTMGMHYMQKFKALIFNKKNPFFL